MKIRILLLLLLFFGFIEQASASMKLEAEYPYSLEQKDIRTVAGGSTMPLYINLTSHDIPHEQDAEITVTLPEGFSALAEHGWNIENTPEGATVKKAWRLSKDYGQDFDLIYIKAEEGLPDGERHFDVKAEGPGFMETKRIDFAYSREEKAASPEEAPDTAKFNWYIQAVTFPVDSLGQRDDRSAPGVIYIRDTSLEGFRNRMTGDGATNWAAVFNSPATYLLLDMRNPQMDIRVLKFTAELLDKDTGKVIPGLCTAGKVNDDTGEGWSGDAESNEATTALISLDGKKAQTFILPLYVDYFEVLGGEYNMRVTVSGNGQEKIQEVPLTIERRHSMGLIAVAFSIACLLLIIISAGRIKGCIRKIGARGAITVALFAAIAFGGIVLPTTMVGDLLHAFLGPFSGLITGILSGVLQYLLIMSLLMLFRKSGTVALLFLVKYMLSGLMLGHFTPIGLLSYCVYIAVLEGVLNFTGFYRKEEITPGFMALTAVLMGISDAFITFVNLEQMMFFYRLYYADWYIVMYMVINGFLYSAAGSWLGYKTGMKLCQVMGE